MIQVSAAVRLIPVVYYEYTGRDDNVQRRKICEAIMCSLVRTLVKYSSCLRNKCALDLLSDNFTVSSERTHQLRPPLSIEASQMTFLCLPMPPPGSDRSPFAVSSR